MRKTLKTFLIGAVAGMAAMSVLLAKGVFPNPKNKD